jgi:hypothetical protein
LGDWCDEWITAWGDRDVFAQLPLFVLLLVVVMSMWGWQSWKYECEQTGHPCVDLPMALLLLLLLLLAVLDAVLAA